MKIKFIKAHEILDSRGLPTLQIEMESANSIGASFSVPAGKSTGLNEALEKRDQDKKRFDGNGVLACIKIVEQLKPYLIGFELGQQTRFDEMLIHLDGTPNKQNLGANTLLGLSGAYLRLSAKLMKQNLWHYIAYLTGSKPLFPRLYANLINGGKHAPGLDVQEFMIVPKSTTPSEVIPQIATFYKELGHALSDEFGPAATLIGDEGGYAPGGIKHDQALKFLDQLRNSRIDLACDIAASSFCKKGQYNFEGQNLTVAGLINKFIEWDKTYHLLSLEDPVAENDLEGLELLVAKNPRFAIIGDDLTVTSAEKIIKLAKAKLVSGVIIKPNQIGTVSETFTAITAAKQVGIKIIVSHRSGETNDDFVSDLAFGVGAFGFKLGAPARGERIAKYNRLLAIEREAR